MSSGPWGAVIGGLVGAGLGVSKVYFCESLAEAGVNWAAERMGEHAVNQGGTVEQQRLAEQGGRAIGTGVGMFANPFISGAVNNTTSRLRQPTASSTAKQTTRAPSSTVSRDARAFVSQRNAQPAANSNIPQSTLRQAERNCTTAANTQAADAVSQTRLTANGGRVPSGSARVMPTHSVRVTPFTPKGSTTTPAAANGRASTSRAGSTSTPTTVKTERPGTSTPAARASTPVAPATATTPKAPTPTVAAATVKGPSVPTPPAPKGAAPKPPVPAASGVKVTPALVKAVPSKAPKGILRKPAAQDKAPATTKQMRFDTKEPEVRGKSLKEIRKESFTFDSTLFTNMITWTSPKGTVQTYKIYQRNDIDWNLIRINGDVRFRGKTNAEAARAGKAPQLADGYFATLHHINQDGMGALAEASTRYHGVGKPGQRILHSLYGSNKPHPTNPVDRPLFSVDNTEYWKWRIADAEK